MTSPHKVRRDACQSRGNMRALNTIGLWSIGIMRTGAVEWSLEFFVVIGRVVKGTAQTKQNGFGNLRRLCAPATTEIHNNNNIIAPHTRGFLHL
jgi:hypothetical protein